MRWGFSSIRCRITSSLEVGAMRDPEGISSGVSPSVERGGCGLDEVSGEDRGV